jgi:hypothetical protein
MKRHTTARPSEPAPATVRIEFSPAVIEDLLAAASPEYLASIREARAQYRAGRVHSFEEIFGR